MFLIVIYIALRFRSFPFGIGAIVATIHDILITVGLLALLGREFNLVVVAALLTLVGYSVNDTVVVFDRIHPNRRDGTWPRLTTNPRVFAQATAAHAFFGALLGALVRA